MLIETCPYCNMNKYIEKKIHIGGVVVFLKRCPTFSSCYDEPPEKEHSFESIPTLKESEQHETEQAEMKLNFYKEQEKIRNQLLMFRFKYKYKLTSSIYKLMFSKKLKYPPKN